MAKTLTLDRTFVHTGAFYGPGQVTIENDDVAADIEAKQAKLKEIPSGAALTEHLSLTTVPPQTPEEVDIQIARLQLVRERLVAEQEAQSAAANGSEMEAANAIDAQTAQKLAAAGYDTMDKMQAASDDELLAVPGIGPATIAKIRAQS